MTSGEMREGEKRGPWVEWDMFSFPVVAAGDCHMMAGRKGVYWYRLSRCALRLRVDN